MARKPPEDLPVIGWREWVALPDLGVPAIKAKVDTGARTSSLHAWEMETLERDGLEIARFTIHPYQDDVEVTIEAEAELVDRRKVRSSMGRRQERLVIRTTARLRGESWPIEVTLANRDAMGFRMLLGRQAIRGRFLVDAGTSFHGGEPEAARRGAGRGTKEETGTPTDGSEEST